MRRKGKDGAVTRSKFLKSTNQPEKFVERGVDYEDEILRAAKDPQEILSKHPQVLRNVLKKSSNGPQVLINNLLYTIIYAIIYKPPWRSG